MLVVLFYVDFLKKTVIRDDGTYVLKALEKVLQEDCLMR